MTGLTAGQLHATAEVQERQRRAPLGRIAAIAKLSALGVIIWLVTGETRVSYDLGLWRYQPGVVLDHRFVYEKLSDGETVDGLEAILVQALLDRVKEEFSSDGWEQLDELDWESEKSAFQIVTSSPPSSSVRSTIRSSVSCSIVAEAFSFR